MGSHISQYRGRKRVAHGGNMDGYSTELAFLPNDGIGVVVLTNLDYTGLPGAIAWNVFDRLLGLEQAPWSQRYLQMETKAKESEAEAGVRATRRKRQSHRGRSPAG